MKRIFSILLLLAQPAFPAQGFFTLANTWNAVTKAPDMANNANFTIALWARRDDMTGAGTSTGILFDHGEFTGPSYSCSQFYLGWFNGVTQQFRVNVPIDGGASDHNVLFGPTDFKGDLTWHQFTITHTSANVWTLYQDGVSVTSSSTGFATDPACLITAGSFGVQCGATPAGTDEYCYMADTAEWLSVLPLTDIKALAHGTRPNMVSAKPAVWWPWDDEWEGSLALGIPIPDSPDLSGNVNTMQRPSAVVYNQKPAGHCPCIPATGEATH